MNYVDIYGNLIESDDGSTYKITPQYGGMSTSGTIHYKDLEQQNFLEYISKVLDIMVLITNVTTGSKEVKDFNEGFKLYNSYKMLGNEVTITVVNKETAKVLYGNGK